MSNELTVMAVGDIFISTPEFYPAIPHATPIKTERKDLYSWLEKVAPTLQQGDFTFGNLEGPICGPSSEAGVPLYGDLASELRMPPSMAETLKRAGITGLSTSGNLIMGSGAEGMLETLQHLDRAGVAHAGSGRNIAEAHKPAIMEKRGVKVAFLAYSSVFSPGVAPAGKNKAGIAVVSVGTGYEIPSNTLYSPGVLPKMITTPFPKDAEAMLADVRAARAEADVVVVSWHWGATKWANSRALGIPLEDSPFFVLGYQEDMGRAAIDAGADLVMGHHPHRLQGMEIYKGKLICYSLCNLTMSFGEGINFGEESVIVKGYIDPATKKLNRFTVIPMFIPTETMVPDVVPVPKAGPIIAELKRLSKKYGTRFEVESGEVVVHPK